MLFLSSEDFFFGGGDFLKKKTYRNTIRVSNSLDPDQARHYVWPYLGPNCSLMLSADDKSPC